MQLPLSHVSLAPQSEFPKHWLVVQTRSTQLFPAGHCEAIVHSPHAFGPVGSFVRVPQYGVEPLHWALVAHWSQKPPAWHTSPSEPQSVFASQMHVWLVPQCFVAHWLSLTHSTH